MISVYQRTEKDLRKGDDQILGTVSSGSGIAQCGHPGDIVQPFFLHVAGGCNLESTIGKSGMNQKQIEEH